MTARLEIDKVSRSFGDFTALDAVSLTIEPGEFIVLLGPSGCGKTTLLSILGGFLEPTSGMVRIGGKDMTHVPPAKRPTTTMFQDYALFPHMSLLDNVGFGLRMAGQGKAQRDEKALSMLDMVGLKSSAAKRPHELSGGQRQRVALARALAVDPDVLLLDEPLGALDLKLRRQMQDELKAIQRRIGTTFIHVTHDQEEAMAIADRIVVMNQGRIEDEGAPARIYMQPRSHFSAGFMGEVNRIKGRIAGLDGDKAHVATAFGNLPVPLSAFADPLPVGLPETNGQAVTLLVRPEHLRSGEPDGALIDLGPARISSGAFFGTHYRCHLEPERHKAQSLVAHLPQASRFAPGDTLPLLADPAGLVVLAGHGEGEG